MKQGQAKSNVDLVYDLFKIPIPIPETASVV